MKAILPAFFLLLSFVTQAQIFNIEDENTSLSIDKTIEYSAAFSYFLNYQGMDVKEYKWTCEWIAPEEWSSQICLNPTKCYGFDTKEAILEFSPGVNYEFALKVFHNETCGTGTYTMNLLDIATGEVLDKVISNVEVVGCTTNTQESYASAIINIYPNPIQHSFSLTGVRFKELLIRDLNGNLVKNFSEGQEFEISDLSPAVYFVQIVTKEGFVYNKKVIKN